jgi:hypothetical protein
MQRSRTKIAALVLMVMLALPVVFLLSLQLQQWYWKHTARERMEESALQTITVNAHEIVWEKKGKELRIGRHLFDVKTFESTSNGIKAKGVWDHQEAAIENMLASHREHSAGYHILLLLLGAIFIAFQVPGKKYRNVALIRGFSCTPLIAFEGEILSPPPRCAISSGQ